MRIPLLKRERPHWFAFDYTRHESFEKINYMFVYGHTQFFQIQWYHCFLAWNNPPLPLNQDQNSCCPIDDLILTRWHDNASTLPPHPINTVARTKESSIYLFYPGADFTHIWTKSLFSPCWVIVHVLVLPFVRQCLGCLVALANF